MSTHCAEPTSSLFHAGIYIVWLRSIWAGSLPVVYDGLRVWKTGRPCRLPSRCWAISIPTKSAPLLRWIPQSWGFLNITRQGSSGQALLLHHCFHMERGWWCFYITRSTLPERPWVRMGLGGNTGPAYFLQRTAIEINCFCLWQSPKAHPGAAAQRCRGLASDQVIGTIFSTNQGEKLLGLYEFRHRSRTVTIFIQIMMINYDKPLFVLSSQFSDKAVLFLLPFDVSWCASIARFFCRDFSKLSPYVFICSTRPQLYEFSACTIQAGTKRKDFRLVSMEVG